MGIIKVSIIIVLYVILMIFLTLKKHFIKLMGTMFLTTVAGLLHTWIFKTTQHILNFEKDSEYIRIIQD